MVNDTKKETVKPSSNLQDAKTKKYALSVMVGNSEREIVKPGSNSGWVHYVHFHTNTFGKGMNLSCLPPAIG